MVFISQYFMKLRPVLLGIMCLVTLNACTTLGPNFTEPDVEWLNKWEEDTYSRADSVVEYSNVDLQFWWQIFEDPLLNNLIELVKGENPSLQIAGLRVLESRATLGIAKSTQYPQVQQATSAFQYSNTHAWDGTVSDSNESFTTFQSGFTLGWEMDFWGRFQRGIESADASFFASIANQQNLQVLLTAQVVDAYYSYHTTLLQIEIARKNAEIQKRSFEITEQLYDSGQKGELDLQQAKTQYMATLSSIPSLEIILAQVRNTLTTLLGRAPGDLPELDGDTEALPILQEDVIKNIPASLLMRRPDIREASWQVAAQSAQIGIAEADLYPSISLFGNINFSTHSMSGSANTLNLGIGPSLTWNLFDHGLIKNNVRLQDAKLQRAIENYQMVALQAVREIDNSMVAILKTREQKIPQSQATQAANRSLELANTRYKEGYADFQRVLDAQKAAAAQASNELANDSNHISAIISFYKAVGGGWQEQTVEQMVRSKTLEIMENRTDWGNLLHSLPQEN